MMEINTFMVSLAFDRAEKLDALREEFENMRVPVLLGQSTPMKRSITSIEAGEAVWVQYNTARDIMYYWPAVVDKCGLTYNVKFHPDPVHGKLAWSQKIHS